MYVPGEDKLDVWVKVYSTVAPVAKLLLYGSVITGPSLILKDTLIVVIIPVLIFLNWNLIISEEVKEHPVSGVTADKAAKFWAFTSPENETNKITTIFIANFLINLIF